MGRKGLAAGTQGTRSGEGSRVEAGGHDGHEHDAHERLVWPVNDDNQNLSSVPSCRPHGWRLPVL